MAPRLQLPAPTIVDRAIAYFDPKRGYERLRYRGALALAGAYAGAKKDRRLTKGWTTSSGSPSADIVDDLNVIRERSRDLVRNNPIAASTISTPTINVIGTGLAVDPQIDWQTLGMTEDEAAEWERVALTEFEAWASQPSACDAAKTHDFYQLQGIGFGSQLQSGDCFALLPLTEPDLRISEYGLRIALVEGDRVCTPKGKTDSELLAAGIEFDPTGAPKTCYIARQHPGSDYAKTIEWDPVPVFGAESGRRNVLHMFSAKRPNQPRGVPLLAPVIETLKAISDWTENELQATLISSLFTAFVTTQAGTGLQTDPNQPPAKPGDDLSLSPGAIVDLLPGESIQFSNPPRPSTQFHQFVDQCCVLIGMGTDIPYEILVKKFQASYSAARAAMLAAFKSFLVSRAQMATQFCQPVYEAFLTEGVLNGRIYAPGFLDDPHIRAAYLRCEWYGDAPGQINPTDEADASGKRLDLLLTTYSQEALAIGGRTFRGVLARRKREEMEIASAGLTRRAPEPAAAGPAPAKKDGADKPDAPDTGDETEDA